MRRIPAQADRQCGVFTTTQALACGWSPHTLLDSIARGDLVRLRRGAYCAFEVVAARIGDSTPGVTGYAEHAQRDVLLGLRGAAAALRVPMATVSHISAASLNGLPLLTGPKIPCVTLPPPLRTREAGLHVHRQPIPPGQLDPRYQLGVTTAARTCLDLGREFGLPTALVAADAAVRTGLTTQDELTALRADLRGRAGWPAATDLCSMVDGRSESALESVSRLAMAGIRPAPELQTELRTASGRFVARVDFFWRQLGVVGEADGRGKYTGDALWREKRREQSLADLGLTVVRWDWQTVRHPRALVNLVLEAFGRAERLRSAGVGTNFLAA